jgi:hypothetical protein
MGAVPRVALLALASLLPLACGGGGADPKFPPRPAGCAVEVVASSPAFPTQNIGVAVARCSADIDNAACLRQLQDEVCALGGDVVWGVTMPPKVVDAGKQLSGRAAKRRGPPVSP